MPHESRLKFSTDEILATFRLARRCSLRASNVTAALMPTVTTARREPGFGFPRLRHGRRRISRTPGTPLFDIPAISTAASAERRAGKFLLRSGVREPMIRTLTEIAIVEGFGAMIRELPVPPLASFIHEETRGTALAHLSARAIRGTSGEGGMVGGGRASPDVGRGARCSVVESRGRSCWKFTPRAS